MHSFVNLVSHVIFSTAERRPFIAREMEIELHAYIGALPREFKGRGLSVNGTGDHIHLLVSLPATISMADAVGMIKANSSRWIKERFATRLFAWQRGYAAFSVSQSNVAAVQTYLGGQPAHHRRVSFKDELIAFLKKNKIDYDERYIWL